MSVLRARVGKALHARGDTVSVEQTVLALDVAVARVLLLSLLGGASPDEVAQAELVDAVLVPLLQVEIAVTNSPTSGSESL